jgi:O-antigen/teichoic acid export membrane protein
MNLKLFGKDAVIYAIGNIGARGASFLLIPLYTYSLSVADYGLLATLLLTSQIMITFMGLGARTAFIRFAAEYQSQNLMGRLLGSSVLINLAGGLIVSGIAISFLLPLFRQALHTDDVLEYMVLTCCVAMSQSLWVHGITYYRARGESLKYILFCISAPVLLIIINAWFLLILPGAVKEALLSQVIVYSGLCLFVFLDVFPKNGIEVSIPLIWKLVQFGFPLIFVMSGDLIMDASAVYFLGYFGDLEQVAIYSLGQKISQISQMVLILPFQSAYEPFVYSNINTPAIRAAIAKVLTYLMLSFAFVAFCIVFIARDLLPIIAPPDYSPAYLVIFLLLPGIAFQGVYYVGESLLHIKNKTYVTATSVAIFTALSMIANFLLIPFWGMYGAIFVFYVTYISMALVVMMLGMRTFPIRLETGRLATAGVVLVSLLLSVFFFRETSAYVYYSMIPMAVCASVALLYFGGFFDNQEKSLIKDILHIQRAISL